MIGYLQGKVKFAAAEYVILLCGGVGYRIELGPKSMSYEEGTDASFFIYTHVRESEFRLFGFSDTKELDLFETLLDVGGIGPKSAMNLVSTLGYNRLVQYILQKDAKHIRVPGVGKKSAEKIVFELHDKLKDRGLTIDPDTGDMQKIDPKNIEETKAALKALGYGKKDIDTVMQNISENPELSDVRSEALLKYALSMI